MSNDNSKLLRIAIDGPSASGKSTIAKLLAKEYGIEYVDTGAMYRALGLKMKREDVPCQEGDALTDLLESTEIDFVEGKIYLGGEDVSDLIRTQEISKMASDCSALPPVRAKLVAIQKDMGATKSVAMDGRDICSVVMPDAEYKFFVTASAEERAKRRFLELQGKGQNPDFETILKEVNERDYNDSHRELTPLKKTADAVEIDTTDMTIEEVMERVKSIIENGHI